MPRPRQMLCLKCTNNAGMNSMVYGRNFGLVLQATSAINAGVVTWTLLGIYAATAVVNIQVDL